MSARIDGGCQSLLDEVIRQRDRLRYENGRLHDELRRMTADRDLLHKRAVEAEVDGDRRLAENSYLHDELCRMTDERDRLRREIETMARMYRTF